MSYHGSRKARKKRSAFKGENEFQRINRQARARAERQRKALEDSRPFTFSDRVTSRLTDSDGETSDEAEL